MDKLTKAIGAFVLALVLIVAISLLGAYPTKWLVNYVLAPGFIYFVFGVTKIGFWKALTTNILAGQLFKSTSTSSK
jgi:Flp pilus assembly protein TadB